MNSHKSKKVVYNGRYKKKLAKIKQSIREFVHENAALCDEINDTQEKVIVRMEERKFLLKKLCLFEPQVEQEVEALSNSLYNQSPANNQSESKRSNKRKTESNREHKKSSQSQSRPRKPSSKQKKKLVQPVPLDPTGRPVFPMELGSLTIHSLGEIVSDRRDFHSEEAIYPVGYVSTKIYGSLRDPMQMCIYTCKISDANGTPRFEIASDDNSPPIVGGTPDVCHTLLLQKINDALSLNVVTTRPRGNDFFGLTHPTVLNLIQSSPGARRCSNYKWTRFEVAKHADQHVEDSDTTLCHKMLQRSIEHCKYKMSRTLDSSGDYYEKNNMY